VRLRRPGARTREAGLALALGGAGLSLRDLAVLYAALADEGRARPLAWTEAEVGEGRGVRLLRTEAARDVVDILRETPPPDGRAPTSLSRGRAQTGVQDRHLLRLPRRRGRGDRRAVRDRRLDGRADGGARGGLTGRDVAAPLLFDVADALDAPASAPRPLAPRRAPQALAELTPAGRGPSLIFPPDGATVQVDALGPGSRGLVLAARGEGLRWYAGAGAVGRRSATGRRSGGPKPPASTG
jgi:penicillin-binding protein 1C